MNPKSPHARFGVPLVFLALMLLACLLFFFRAKDKAHMGQNTPQVPTGPFTLEYPDYFGGRYQIPENNPISKEGVALGRLLFYEPKLSTNNQISCASCHQQKWAITDGGRFSIGVDGSLERMAMAIAQFERTLISDDSPYDRYLKGRYTPTPGELRSIQLFENAPDPENGIRGANCAQCHGGPKTYLEQFRNNGLDIEPTDLGREGITNFVADRGRFRVPILCNIAVTGPYMHDGRFTGLEEVIDHYDDHLLNSPTLSTVLKNTANGPKGKGLGLTVQEKEDLLAFLQMLADSTFMNNPKFSNPHKL